MKKPQGYLLALDASTTEIGVCIWDKENSTLVELSHYTLNKDFTLLEKAAEFKDWLGGLLDEIPQINEVVLEEAFGKMLGGKTSVDVLRKLMQMNFAYQYLCHEQGLPVNLMTVHQVRKSAFPRLKLKSRAKSGGKDQKTQVFDHVRTVLGESYFPTKVISRGKNKGEVRYEDYCTDMSDAYVVCLGLVNSRL